MRANLLSVLLGGLLVGAGSLLGAGAPSSRAGVAMGDAPTVVTTSASDSPTSIFLWRLHAARVLDVTRYQAERVDDGRGGTSLRLSAETCEHAPPEGAK